MIVYQTLTNIGRCKCNSAFGMDAEIDPWEQFSTQLTLEALSAAPRVQLIKTLQRINYWTLLIKANIKIVIFYFYQMRN